jgi:CRISPR/Cas system-associated protein Cas5 (RAMP superfamily)
MLPPETTVWGALGYAAGSQALLTLVEEYGEWLRQTQEAEDKKREDHTIKTISAQETRVQAVCAQIDKL